MPWRISRGHHRSEEPELSRGAWFRGREQGQIVKQSSTVTSSMGRFPRSKVGGWPQGRDHDLQTIWMEGRRASADRPEGGMEIFSQSGKKGLLGPKPGKGKQWDPPRLGSRV